MYQFNIADVHADRKSQFFGRPHSVKDTAEITRTRKALSKNSSDRSLWLNLAQLLTSQLRYREAIEAYTRMLELDENDCEAYHLRACAYLTTMQAKKAMEDAAACYYADPDNLDYLLTMAIARYMNKGHKEAAFLFSRAVELAEDDPEMHVVAMYWTAVCSVRTGRVIREWKRYDFSSKVVRNTGYRDGLAYLAGKMTEKELRAKVAEESDSAIANIALYPLTLKLFEKGRNKEMGLVIKQILNNADSWFGYGYMATYYDEVNRKRNPEATSEAPVAKVAAAKG